MKIKIIGIANNIPITSKNEKARTENNKKLLFISSFLLFFS